MGTPAIRFLKQLGLAFEVVSYAHLQKGAAYAARATGFPLARIVKTLVVTGGPKNNAVVLVPGDRPVDWKRLACALGTKQVRMADPLTAERLTGYHVGGISPFGLKQALPAVMDEALLAWEEVLINAGRRGLMLKMAPLDIRLGLNCLVAAVSAT
jgi:Cys-tRNA(Pro)/Cys-tRNA(Cys) deacylase